MEWIQPYTAKDLAKKPMPEVILDLQELTHLYPSTCKEVFNKYLDELSSEKVSLDPRYRHLRLIATIEKRGSSGSSSETGDEQDSPPESILDQPSALSGSNDERSDVRL